MMLLLLLLQFISATAQGEEPVSGASCPIGGMVLMVALACPPDAVTALLPSGTSAHVLRGALDGFDATTVRDLLAGQARMSPSRFTFAHAGVQVSANGLWVRHVTPSGDGFALALSRKPMQETTRVLLTSLAGGAAVTRDTMDVSRQDLLLARCRIAGFDVILAIHALCERAAYSDLMLADQKRLMDDVRGIPRERWIEDVVLSSAPDSTAPTR